MKVTPGLPEAEVCEQEAYRINIGDGREAGWAEGRAVTRSRQRPQLVPWGSAAHPELRPRDQTVSMSNWSRVAGGVDMTLVKATA